MDPTRRAMLQTLGILISMTLPATEATEKVIDPEVKLLETGCGHLFENGGGSYDAMH